MDFGDSPWYNEKHEIVDIGGMYYVIFRYHVSEYLVHIKHHSNKDCIYNRGLVCVFSKSHNVCMSVRMCVTLVNISQTSITSKLLPLKLLVAFLHTFTSLIYLY